MEQHPVAGVELLAGIDFPWDIRPMVRHHYEWWDGSGYPDKLAGENIPLSARILCIADVHDALTTDRPYRQGYSHEKAMEIMENDVGRLFDPELFGYFREIVDLRLPAQPGSDPTEEPVFACSAKLTLQSYAGVAAAPQSLDERTARDTRSCGARSIPATLCN